MGHETWDYLTLPERERAQLTDLGRAGWELAGLGGEPGEPLLYLKRPALDLRERVTLDQRRRYYESLGLEPGTQSDADRP